MSNDKSYKYVFNKVYTGDYLKYKLGHEVINFIRSDDGCRYVYINPWGNRCEESDNIEYVLHIVPFKSNNKTYYELLGASKIDKNNSYKYGEDEKYKEMLNSIYYNGHNIKEIFDLPSDDKSAHLFSYKASKLLIPKSGIRIIIEMNKVPKYNPDTNVLSVSCFTKHNVVYSKEDDDEYIDKIIELLEESNEDFDINKQDDELCTAAICDRTNLEDSTSNQIAYFLSRDENIMNHFVKFLLSKKGIKSEIDESYEINRERDNIDLLFKSKNNIFVIENKIDSNIRDYSDIKDGEIESQLSKYYDIVCNNEKDNYYKGVSNNNKFFFILTPYYNSISESMLKEKYLHGEKYTHITYDDLFDFFNNEEYNPDGDSNDSYIYDDFIKSLYYIKSSLARQNEMTAYIRFKQKIKKLNNRGNINER